MADSPKLPPKPPTPLASPNADERSREIEPFIVDSRPHLAPGEGSRRKPTERDRSAGRSVEELLAAIGDEDDEFADESD